MADLPNWIVKNAKGVFDIDPDIIYPQLLQELGAPPEKDQYWLELAFQCMKYEARKVIREAGLDPRPDKALCLNVMAGGGRGERWTLTGRPRGKGAQAAVQEKAERYAGLRGFLPS